MALLFAIAGSVPRIQWLISPHRWLYTFAIFTFPRISNILNLFITFIGVGIALPFTIGLLTPIIQIFNKGFTFSGDIILSQNHMLSLFLKYMTLGIITLPIWRYRMSKLEEF